MEQVTERRDPSVRYWIVLGVGVLLFSLPVAALLLGGEERISQVFAKEAPASQPAVLPSSDTLITVAKQAKASVVNVSSTRKIVGGQESAESPFPFFDDPFFRRFFGEEFEHRFRMPIEFRQQGMGSGVIVSADGYIVTNHHVVEDADALDVSLADNRRFKAKVIASDPRTDVAVIKIEATGLSALPWGDSSQLQVGELVLAVGNPFGLNQTVTMGIISAVGRANMGIVDYEDFIQTDAAINPGNSGGALVNLKGELIGINTAIFSRTGGYMGIGFAIPSRMAKNVMDHLIRHGKVVRGWLGISIQEMTDALAKEFGAPDTTGALVAEVMDESPARKAGLERGDIIRTYGGTEVKDAAHLRTLVAESAPGRQVVLTVWREKRSRSMEVTLGELPKELGARRRSDEAKGEHALAGVAVESLSREDLKGLRLKGGVAVRRIDPESQAAESGLREGDVIREINRKPVKSVEDFERIVRTLSPKERILLLITRGQATMFLTITAE